MRTVDERGFRRQNGPLFIMKIYVKLILTTMFWGGTFVAGKVAAQNVGPFSIGFLRFAIASTLLLALTWKTEGRLPALRKSQVVPIILLGLIGIFAYNVMFYKGLRIIEASRAALIIATCPIFITILSALFLKEKITALKALGIAISVCGAAVAISKGDIAQIISGGLGRGEMYIFICVLNWTIYSLIGKGVMKEMSPLTAVSYSSVVGAVALSAPACVEGLIGNLAHQAARDWLCISYLGVFGTVIGFVWYYQGVEHLGPTKAGLFINFVPVFGILCA
ncbi:MAG: DMT family transporter, partial [Planctomycetota bacterium]